MENQAAFDYLKIEDDTKALVNEIDKSDDILKNLEELLSNFRNSLTFIKSEMT